MSQNTETRFTCDNPTCDQETTAPCRDGWLSSSVSAGDLDAGGYVRLFALDACSLRCMSDAVLARIDEVAIDRLAAQIERKGAPAASYCLAYEGKQWADGPFTLEKAQLLAKEWETDRSIVGRVFVHHAVKLDARPWMPTVEHLLEEMNERARDDGWGDPDDCDAIFDMTNKQAEIAQAELTAWADRWIGKSQMHFVGDRVEENADG